MSVVIVRGARVVSPVAGARGADAGRLRVWERADVVVRDGLIAEVRAGGMPSPGPGGAGADLSQRERWGHAREIDARGRVLAPAFVDCHTHACWAGDRLDEWEKRRRGATYLEIQRAGGGIMNTVRAVRAASQGQLADALRERLGAALRGGTTTIEVKSGYGLTTRDELKMLRAIHEAATGLPGTVVPTALLGHAIDPDEPRFVQRTIEETLPAVHAEFPGIAVDAYCEVGAWSLPQCRALFERAMALGLPRRVHADQFHALGATRMGVDMGFVSVDHLEATTREGLGLLARSSTAGVLLPACGLHVDGRYADGRTLIDAGGAVAVATNWNPGSAPTGSMPLAMALAVRGCGLSPEEAIAAGTAGGAHVLGLRDRGAVEAGMRADLVLLRHTDERMLAYELGGDPVDMVLCGGAVVKE